MRTDTFGNLKVHLAGGSDGSGAGAGPLVVLLHGYGAPGTDLVNVYQAIPAPPGTRFAFPEAPITLGPAFMAQGRCWWDLDVVALTAMAGGGDTQAWAQHVPEGLADARAQLSRCLDELCRELEVPEGQLVLGGFSQGAMLSLDLALREPQRKLLYLLLLSGSVICLDEWKSLLAARRGQKVLQSHGQVDSVLPFELATELNGLLEQAGLATEFVTFHGDHGIPPAVLQLAGKKLCEAVASS